MRICAALMVLMLSPLAYGAETYATVEQFVGHATGGHIEKYECGISSDYPKYRGCSVGTAASAPKYARVFGMLVARADAQGFIFVLERTREGTFRLAEQSRTFAVPTARGDAIGIEELVADGDDRFHVQFTSGAWGAPDTDVYRFQLVSGKWRVSGRDRHTLARCKDEAGAEFIGDGGEYSDNYLTGDTVRTEYDNCKRTPPVKGRAKFPPAFLSDFAPG